MTLTDFFTKMYEILTLPGQMLHQASVSMNEFQYDELLLYDYLGYLHNAMGTPLYMLFTTVAIIGISAMLWSMVIKAAAWIMEIIPVL